MTSFTRENLLPFAFTAAVLLIGSAIYFHLGSPNSVPMGQLAQMYGGMQYKAAFSPKGELKLFALADSGKLFQIPAMDGSRLPTSTSMVLGYAEASMMKKEGLISGTGSALDGFFGINTRIGGILGKTGSPIDMLHFLSPAQFSAIEGEQGKVAVLLKGTMPKLFYYFDAGENVPRMALAEGSLGNYKGGAENGKQYIPMLIGSDEAKMMRSERLFSNVGDTIDGFFGKNVKVAGILAKTNSTLDMMHFVPPGAGLQ